MVNHHQIAQVEHSFTKIKDTKWQKVPEKPDEPFLPPTKGMKWVFAHEMSDEFKYKDAKANLPLDENKWEVNNSNWVGRKPSYFKRDNVYVHDNSLFLKSKFESERPKDLPKGYHSYSTSFVRTKAKRKYGYYEIICRMMDSKVSSGFWFSNPFENNVWTELDVFEYSTSDKEFRSEKKKHLHFKRLFNTNCWVHKHPDVDTPQNDSKSYDLGFDLSKKRVKIGFNWQKDKIDWYVNDVLIRSEDNDYFHQALHLQLDSETYPNWFGLPDPEDDKLPAWFRVFYVRAWYQVPLSGQEKKLMASN